MALRNKEEALRLLNRVFKELQYGRRDMKLSWGDNTELFSTSMRKYLEGRLPEVPYHNIQFCTTVLKEAGLRTQDGTGSNTQHFINSELTEVPFDRLLRSTTWVVRFGTSPPGKSLAVKPLQVNRAWWRLQESDVVDQVVAAGPLQLGVLNRPPIDVLQNGSMQLSRSAADAVLEALGRLDLLRVYEGVCYVVRQHTQQEVKYKDLDADRPFVRWPVDFQPAGVASDDMPAEPSVTTPVSVRTIVVTDEVVAERFRELMALVLKVEGERDEANSKQAELEARIGELSGDLTAARKQLKNQQRLELELKAAQERAANLDQALRQLRANSLERGQQLAELEKVVATLKRQALSKETQALVDATLRRLRSRSS